MSGTGYYQIEAHSYGILGVASHDFWVLRGPDGVIMQELHGLATGSSTNRYEDAKDIGVFGDELGFYKPAHRYGDTPDDRDSVVTYRGDATDVLDRWNEAVNSTDYLNSLHVPYTPLGFIDPLGDVINSNSAFRTFGELMGLPVKDFPWRTEPGMDTGLEDILKKFGKDSPPPPLSLLDKLRDFLFTPAYGDEINPSLSDFFLAAKGWLAPRRDPLVLDLDGDGIETVGLNATNPILFDHDADGVKTGTGWVLPDDAFLVLDRNGNGLIDSGRELFGDATLKSNGQLASDGFDALADLDSNLDGHVNAADSAFGALRLWRDLNQDGASQAAELFTLASQGIAGIRVAQTENNQVLANRNQIADLRKGRGHPLASLGQ